MSNILRLNVVDVKGGDALTMEDPGGDRLDVRVWGVDCPESSQPFGPVAEEVAREMVEGELVTVAVTGRDRYGRVVGRVGVNGLDLGRSLVLSGCAWHCRRHGTSEQLKNLERRARSRKAGLWSQEDPVPPWEHRGEPGVSGDGLLKSLAWFVLGALVVIALLGIAAVGPSFVPAGV